MKYDITYEWATEVFLSRMKHDHPETGVSAEMDWLPEFDENILEEVERLNVILPLIKWCVENDKMTDDLKGELNWYYRAYKEGRRDFLESDEEEVVLKDLLWCYHKVFG